MKKIFTILILLLCLNSTYSQSCLNDSLIISTGFDPTTRQTAIGRDLKWIVTDANSFALNSGKGVTLNSGAYIGNPSWFPSSLKMPGASISFSNDFTTNDNRPTPIGDPSATFTRTFSTCKDDSFFIDIDFARDNYVTNFTIDGVITVISPDPRTGNASLFTSLQHIRTVTFFLPSGNHEINVTLANWNQGILTSNGIALLINGNIVGLNNSLIQEDCYCENYVCKDSCTDEFWNLHGNIVNDKNCFIGSINAADFKIRTNNRERMIVKSDGKVGIGILAPSEQLHTNQGVRFEGLTPMDSPTRFIVQDNNGKLFWKDATKTGSNNTWNLGGNSLTATQTLGTNTAFDLPLVTNRIEAARFTTQIANISNSNFLLNPAITWNGKTVNTSNLLGINTDKNNQRLRITSGNKDDQSDALGASIDLHGNKTVINAGRLDLVAGSTANGTTQAIALFTNNGLAQQQSMTVLGNGNVGIGTASPSAALDVNLNSNTSSSLVSKIRRTGTGCLGNGLLLAHGLGKYNYNGITEAGDFGLFFDVDGNPASLSASSGLVIAPWQNNTAGIKIMENGNIGIGTASPNNMLEITKGTAGNSGLRFTNLPNTSMAITNPTTKVLSVNASGDVILVNGAQGSGNTTNLCTSLNTLPKLTGSNTLGCSQLFDDGTSVGVNKTTGFNYTWTGGLVGSAFPQTSGTVKLDVNGVVRGLAFIATSDEKAKTQIQSISNPNNIISNLTGKTYFWNNKTLTSTKADNSKQYGFIAQEVAKILPEAVVVDNEGKYGINYNTFIPIVIESQKELINQIKNQQKQIDDLKNIITKLANSINPTNETSARESITKINVELSDKNIIVLGQNIPNPFDSYTSIGFNIPTDVRNAEINFATLEGKALKSVKIEERGKGILYVYASELATGVYVYSLIADGKLIDSKKMEIKK